MQIRFSRKDRKKAAFPITCKSNGECSFFVFDANNESWINEWACLLEYGRGFLLKNTAEGLAVSRRPGIRVILLNLLHNNGGKGLNMLLEKTLHEKALSEAMG